MEWLVEYTDEFESWWDRLCVAEQEDIVAAVELLELHGPQLPFPYSSGINGSKHRHMRELRFNIKGNHIVFYMHLTRAVVRFCLLAAAKLVKRDGMRNMCLSRMPYMMNTLRHR